MYTRPAVIPAAAPRPLGSPVPGLSSQGVVDDLKIERATELARSRLAEGVHQLYELSTLAYNDEDYAKVSRCMQEIKVLDPHGETLDRTERQSYYMQLTISRIFQDLQLKSRELDSARRELQIKDQQLQEKEKELLASRQIAFSHPPSVQPATLPPLLSPYSGTAPWGYPGSPPSSSSSPGYPYPSVGSLSSMSVPVVKLPELAFGAADWNRYFGDVGVEPALPANIEEILGTHCPFWPSKTIGETHLLVLIPATVNGRAFTLDLLGELIRKPKSGGHATEYCYYDSSVKKQEGGKSRGRSEWVLLTRDVIPGTRSKRYTEQKSLLETRVSGVGLMKGGVPTLLEAGTAVLMHHVKMGERLYSDSPLTYTRCQEAVSSYPTVVGGFAAAGLRVYYHAYDLEDSGLACSWKF